MPIIPKSHYTVKLADVPAVPQDETWVATPHLKVRAFARGLAPTISQAELEWDFGTMKRTEGGPATSVDAAFDYRAKLSLVGKYILIDYRCSPVYGPDGEVVTVSDVDDEWVYDFEGTWIGYVADEGVVRWRQEDDGEGTERIVGGTQTFTAYGPEWWLGRVFMSGTSSREADKAKRPYGYNTGAGEGRELDSAQRANRQPPTEDGEGNIIDPYDPLTHQFDEDAIEWTAAAAAKHVLAEYCPRDEADAPAPWPYVLSAISLTYLDKYKPTVQVEGRTVLEVLDMLIERKRGLTWKVDLIVDPLDGSALQALIGVSSVFAADLDLPNPYAEDPPPSVPAADLKGSFNFDTGYERVEPPQISRSGVRRYNRFRVRGARRTCTFSAAGFAATSSLSEIAGLEINNSFSELWSSEDQTAYEAGVSTIMDAGEYAALEEDEQASRNDIFRDSPRFERVYRHLGIGALVTSSDYNLQPVIHQGTGSIVGSIGMELYTQRINRLTMLQAGYDYADATAVVANGDPDAKDEFLPTQLFAYFANRRSLTTDEGAEIDLGWRRADKMSDHSEIEAFEVGTGGEHEDEIRVKANYTAIPLSGEPGIIIQVSGNGGMAHSLAREWGEGISEPSKFEPVEPPTHLCATMTIEWDAYCEAVWPVAPVAGIVEELLIKLPDERARFDWLVKGTVYDIDDHGRPKQVATPGALRDNRPLCETIARLASTYYSAERAQLVINFRQLAMPFDVGTLLTAIGSDEAAETVNAVCSQITHDLEQGLTSMTFGFAELDFSSLA